MAVPAEQFSEMLEEAGRAKSGGSNDIFNRDNASMYFSSISVGKTLFYFYPNHKSKLTEFLALTKRYFEQKPEFF